MSGTRVDPCDLVWIGSEIGVPLMFAVSFDTREEAMEFFADGDVLHYMEEYGYIVGKPIPAHWYFP